MSYKTDLQGNNIDLQAILDMILALGLVDAPAVPEADTLDGCSWENISKIASEGNAANYWSVGDTKKIIINGTVGKLELSNYETYVYIIGFDHYGAANTIDFGTFKTADSNGVDVCLIDGRYNDGSINGDKYFNINHSSNTNSGGWKDCDLRYDVLGSTNVDGTDAGATTATSPVSGTLMDALPSGLRAVMKPMIVYTDNTGGVINTPDASIIDSRITATVDYLPLLSEFEICGATRYTNSSEAYHQAQYAYYSAGNSRVKYRHKATSSTAYWWVRSPCVDYDTCFVVMETNGSTYYRSSVECVGLAPIFRV